MYNLTNKKFGLWTVIKRVKKPNHLRTKSQHVYWLCKCECGTESVIPAGRLTAFQSSRCKKCAMKHKRKEFGECSFNGLYLRYKHGAISRKLSFNLNKKTFRKLTKRPCYYCKYPPQNKHKGRTAYGEYLYSGIDRINSKHGYSVKNCIPCCSFCNRAKSNKSFEEFTKWMNHLTTLRENQI